MAQYGKASYWDERYTKVPEPFDWYQRYSGVKDLIQQYVKRTDHILMLGCGNSRLSEDMYDDGFTTVANIDISKVVIDQMVEKYRDKTGLSCKSTSFCHTHTHTHTSTPLMTLHSWHVTDASLPLHVCTL